MSAGTTILKMALTGVIVTGVFLGVRSYQKAQQRKLEEKKIGKLPAPDDEVGGGCGSWGPIYDDQGAITGHWVPGSQGQPRCMPACVDGRVATKIGNGDFDWICATSQPPPPVDEYPVPDACVAHIYSRTPQPPEAQMFAAAEQETKAVLEGMRLHLGNRGQNEIMLALIDRISNEPSVRSVMVRRTLEDLAPLCNWWVDAAAMRPSQRLVYQAATALSLAAETEMGWEQPTQARKNMVPREYVGIMSTGPLNLVPGQHVEILVVEGPAMEFGEHVIAKTLSGGPVPKVVVVPRFRGQDVAPRFSAQHKFSVGTQIGLESSPPTSAYRVYPKEWTS
jgi:hypothetical protein